MPKKERQELTGVCKLTKQKGKFVKSHVIPQSYTRPSVKGGYLVQAGMGDRPIKRWTSWYDSKIVIREGEDILARIDDAAFKELTRLKMIWGSWGPSQRLSTADFTQLTASPHGLRRIKSYDSASLRLFFLSILWRSAVCSLKGFEDVVLDENEIEELRLKILNGDPARPNYFPMALMQLSTMGDQHNLTPLLMKKRVPRIVDGRLDFDNFAKEISFFRFYMDGLIIHIHRYHEEDEANPNRLGSDEELLIPTVTFEESSQRINLNNVLSSSYEEWPRETFNLSGPPFPF